ncbi:MAG TPA: PQQ-binding-like beta-propeller repeat protein [Verrucomicrobiae bacterium]|nr:PQQ-binding-like beta-propeller repeat protein [Verrucomicrobiae bacterium]
MRQFRFLVTLLALVMVAAGPGRAEAQTPPSATNLWTAVFPGYENTSSSTPAVAPDGTIYLGTFHGIFLAYNPEGQLKWSFKAGWEIKSSPAIADDGTVYFGSRDRYCYALNPDGTLKWKFATGAWVDSSPAIAADGTIYFGGWDKFFYALNPDGSLKWKTDAGAIVDSSPAISPDGTVYFGSHDHNLYALHPDGTVRWKCATGGAIISSPAIGADGVIYFTSLDGNLYALNPDGTERWRYHSGGTTESSPVLDATGKIGLGINALFVAVSPAGKKLWHAGSALPVDVSAVAVNGRFYFCQAWRTVRAMAADDGDFWSAGLDSNASASPTLTPDGILYVCADFRLYALRPPGDLLPPAPSPWPMFRANPRHTGRAGPSR